ncbi:hypothetical protein HDU82_007498 [Entophlyctis luteolus]|nr:hypothetical protein HDU82_007498 [Entophlyctis luteolus]
MTPLADRNPRRLSLPIELKAHNTGGTESILRVDITQVDKFHTGPQSATTQGPSQLEDNFGLEYAEIRELAALSVEAGNNDWSLLLHTILRDVAGVRRALGRRERGMEEWQSAVSTVSPGYSNFVDEVLRN